MQAAIRWMARNRVAANLLMLTLLCVGLVSATRVKQQTFPDLTLDAVQVRVDYPGAAPAEVEASVVRRVEQQLDGIEGIETVTSVASENVGIVTAELQRSAAPERVLDDIKAEMDRLTTLPEDAESPDVRELSALNGVLQIALYGNVPERTLKELAERVKDDLTSTGEVSYVQVRSVRPYEISIDVPEAKLRAYTLTLQEVAQTVRRASLDLPGGSVNTAGENLLVRTTAQKVTRQELEDIVLISRPDGTQIRLGDVATVRDTFQEADLITRFNGEPASFVQVYRTADERTLDIANVVSSYLERELAPTLPAGLSYGIWQDQSKVLASRLDLLMRNGMQGLALVIIALMLFLNTRLALWTAIGIFLSFVATFAVMLWLGVSINMLSLFGFILAIGIVVDDAIVVGENIATEQERGTPALKAAIQGTIRVAGPVTFAVLTTMAAFLPLLLVPGTFGKLVQDVPTIVITVLAMSLIEVLFILPRHLSHASRPTLNAVSRALARGQARVNKELQRFVQGPLKTSVEFCVRRYGLVLATGVALLTISMGLVLSGHIPFSFFPQIEGDIVQARLELRPGTPLERTQAIVADLEAAALRVAGDLQNTLPDDHPPLVKNVLASVGEQPSQAGPGGSAGIYQSHVAEISVELVDSETRTLPSRRFEEAWRDAVGEIAGVERLVIASDAVQFGSPVQVELSGNDPAAVQAATDVLKAELQTFIGVTDVRDDQEAGKREVQLDLLPQARALGLTADDLAR
ncbi:MAG: efflux RND transporter permease subunit, partial [Bacteroidota bacterium]